MPITEDQVAERVEENPTEMEKYNTKKDAYETESLRASPEKWLKEAADTDGKYWTVEEIANDITPRNDPPRTDKVTGRDKKHGEEMDEFEESDYVKREQSDLIYQGWHSGWHSEIEELEEPPEDYEISPSNRDKLNEKIHDDYSSDQRKKMFKAVLKESYKRKLDSKAKENDSNIVKVIGENGEEAYSVEE